ncbi:acyltransferase family protein [Flavihumibacter sp. R14]|nr:acyltransferase family protein [Flavihumibacter soli]
MNTISTSKKPRLFYLDWLRVLAFGLLVIVNCCEVFAGSSWWIQNTETIPTIGYVLKFFHQWRMPLLFVISGVAVSIVLEKRSIIEFIDDRLTRIFIPLIAGTILIVPPMILFIWRAEGNNIPVQDFYLNLLEFKWFPRGNFHWLHLWYLAFIFIFSIAIIPVMMYLRTGNARSIMTYIIGVLSKSSVLLPIILFFHLPYYISSNFLPGSDLTNLIYYFPYFIFGALFFAQSGIRTTIVNNRRITLIGGTVTAVILYCTIWIRDESINGMMGSTFLGLIQGPLEEPMISLNQWFWLLTFTGFAIRYLNFGNDFLRYANRVVYPFYILHQAIIIALAYYLIPVDASIFAKFCMILSGTVLCVVSAYEIVLKRFTITRVIFGIKTDVNLIGKFPGSVGFINKMIPQVKRINSNPLDPL